jgi:hypothetical protein
MKTLVTITLAAGFAVCLSLVPASVEAASPIDMPGGDAFETKLSQQLDEANAAVENELRSDPTLAGLAAADGGTQEPATPEAISIDKQVEGVPGDEKFEAAFAAWLQQADEAIKNDLSRDPAGLEKIR